MDLLLKLAKHRFKLFDRDSDFINFRQNSKSFLNIRQNAFFLSLEAEWTRMRFFVAMSDE